MRNNTTALAILSVFMVAVAGCSGGETEGTGSETGGNGGQGSAGGGGSGNGTGTPGGNGSAENQAPTAVIQVLVNNTVVEPVNDSYLVTAGRNVTFDATGSTDPEGAGLDFSWDFGDGTPSALPSVNKTFGPGEFRVYLTVSDEAGLNDTTDVLINASLGGSLEVVFFDDVESDAGWTVVNNNAQASGWHRTSAQSYSPTNSWTFQTEVVGGYLDEEETHMTSPPIDLSGASSGTFTFWYKGSTEQGFDYFEWQISTDGATFVTLGQKEDVELSDWTFVNNDITDYVGGTVHIRLYFSSDANCSQQTPLAGLCTGPYTGHFVDDIEVAAG